MYKGLVIGNPRTDAARENLQQAKNAMGGTFGET